MGSAQCKPARLKGEVGRAVSTPNLLFCEVLSILVLGLCTVAIGS